MGPSKSSNLGQIIEYIPGMSGPQPEFTVPVVTIPSTHTYPHSTAFCHPTNTSKDRLYLASYIHPPTEDTLFPYTDSTPRSPSKRSQRAGHGPHAVNQSNHRKPYYFTVDDVLLYNNFHHDFGPFHIGHLYRFALQFHEILGAKENKDRPVVFWSRADPRSESAHHWPGDSC